MNGFIPGESIASLGLGKAALQRLHAQGITTIGQLCESLGGAEMSPAAADDVTLREIRRKLATAGLLIPGSSPPSLGTVEAGLIWVSIMLSPFGLWHPLAIVIVSLTVRYGIHTVRFGQGFRRWLIGLVLFLFSALVLFGLLLSVAAWLPQ
jgi:hypothetical protein